MDTSEKGTSQKDGKDCKGYADTLEEREKSVIKSTLVYRTVYRNGMRIRVKGKYLTINYIEELLEMELADENSIVIWITE